LLNAGVPGFAGFGFEFRIAGETWAAAGVLVKTRLDNTLAVEKSIARAAQKSLP